MIMLVNANHKDPIMTYYSENYNYAIEIVTYCSENYNYAGTLGSSLKISPICDLA